MLQENLTNIVIISFVMPLGLSVLLIWFFITYQKKKYQYESEKKDAQLREQALVIEQQLAIQEERNRIATEMHDELGSGLTIIKYLSDGVIGKSTDEAIGEEIKKIASYSTLLVRNMSEIIWAMNSRFDNLDGLIGYLRRYVTEYLDDNDMEQSFMVDDMHNNINISGEKRRNIYLIVKEILHNAIKYANASKILIEIKCDHKFHLSIFEQDNVGFNPEESFANGNGLYNIKKRILQIGGIYTYENRPNGFYSQISVPIDLLPTDTEIQN
jgi:signal transduction histidine kinase